MATKIEEFNALHLRKGIPDVKSGDTIKVHQKIREANKERIQVFEGLVIARKHGKGINSTITVRKVISGVGVERIFPLHSPIIERIEIIRQGKTRRAKLYFLRRAKGKRARIKNKEFAEIAVAEEVTEQPSEATPPEQETKAESK